MGDSKLKKIFCNEDIVKRLEIWSLMFAIMYIAAQFIIYFIAAILCYKYSFQTLTPLMAAVYSTAGAIQIVPYIIAAVVMLLMKKPGKLKLVGFLSFWTVWKLFGSQILFVIDKALCDLLESSWSFASYQYYFTIEQQLIGQFITYFLSVAVVITLMSAAAIDFFRADSGKTPNNHPKLLKITAYIAVAAAGIPILFMLLNFIVSLHNTVLRSGKILGVIDYIIMIASMAAMAVIGAYCVKNNGLCKNGKNLILVMFAMYLVRGASYFVSGIYSFLYASPFSIITDMISSCLASAALLAVIIIGAYRISLNDKEENL